MSSPRLRILSPFPSGVTNIVLTGKGVARVKVNNELYDRCPYEDPHNLGMRLGTVDVFVGDPAAPMPELDLNGVYQVAAHSVIQKSPQNSDLVVLEKVEFVRNRYQ